MKGHAQGEQPFTFTGPPYAILTAEGVTFTPFVSGDRVGYEVTHADGCKEWVSLVPSTATDEGPGTSNVFLYWSADEDDTLGDALSHVPFIPHNKQDLDL